MYVVENSLLSSGPEVPVFKLAVNSYKQSNEYGFLDFQCLDLSRIILAFGGQAGGAIAWFVYWAREE